MVPNMRFIWKLTQEAGLSHGDTLARKPFDYTLRAPADEA